MSVNMSGEGTLVAAPSFTYSMTVVMQGEGSLQSEFIREIAAEVSMLAEGSMTAEFVREIVNSVIMQGEGSLTASPRKYQVESITVDGPFVPGDKVTIDAAKLRVLKNGEYTSYDGDFFELHPGGNTLTYTDADAGRTVQVRVTWRDRYL